MTTGRINQVTSRERKRQGEGSPLPPPSGPLPLSLGSVEASDRGHGLSPLRTGASLFSTKTLVRRRADPLSFRGDGSKRPDRPSWLARRSHPKALRKDQRPCLVPSGSTCPERISPRLSPPWEGRRRRTPLHEDYRRPSRAYPPWSRRIPKSLGDRTQIWPSAINPQSFAHTASVDQIACLVIPTGIRTMP